jgi:hypothetical protein
VSTVRKLWHTPSTFSCLDFIPVLRNGDRQIFRLKFTSFVFIPHPRLKFAFVQTNTLNGQLSRYSTGLRAGRTGFWGSIPGGKRECFSSPQRPGRLWDPLSLLYNGYQGLLPWGKDGRGVKLTTHLHLVPRSNNAWSYAIPPLPNTPSWRGAQLKESIGTTLPFNLLNDRYKLILYRKCSRKFEWITV